MCEGHRASDVSFVFDTMIHETSSPRSIVVPPLGVVAPRITLAHARKQGLVGGEKRVGRGG